MAKLTVYEKKTCGTCKKAKSYLESQGIEFDLLDILTVPPSRPLLEKLVDDTNVKASLNSRSAIYREKKLGENIPSKKEAIALMEADPNLIKRPVIVKNNNIYLGFAEASLQKFLDS